VLNFLLNSRKNAEAEQKPKAEDKQKLQSSSSDEQKLQSSSSDEQKLQSSSSNEQKQVAEDEQVIVPQQLASAKVFILLFVVCSHPTFLFT